MNIRARINQSLKDWVIMMYKTRQSTGDTQRDIAKKAGISERSVKRILDEAGLATAVPLLKGEAHLVLKELEKSNILPKQFPGFMEVLRHLGVGVHQAGDHIAVQIPHDAYKLTRGMVIKHLVDMEEGTWTELLKEIVTARVAKSHNVGVSTAMLNIINAVDKNAKQ